VDGFVIAERGARWKAAWWRAIRAAHEGVSALAVELVRLHTSDGQTVAIRTDGQRRAEDTHRQDAEKIGGGAALGAVIGASRAAAKARRSARVSAAARARVP